MNFYVVIVLVLTGAVCLNAEPEPLLNNILPLVPVVNLGNVVNNLLASLGLKIDPVTQLVNQTIGTLADLITQKNLLLGVLNNGQLDGLLTAVSKIAGPKGVLSVLQYAFNIVRCLALNLGFSMDEILSKLGALGIFDLALTCNNAPVCVGVTVPPV